MPVVKYTISGTSLLIKGLNAIVTFVLNNKTLILTVAGYILILNAAKLKKIALDKLEVFWNDKVKVALKGLWRVMRQHPYLTLAAVATMLISKYITLVTKTDELRRKQKALAEVQKEAAESAGDELNKINSLRKIVEDTNQSIDNRRTAIKELQKIVPDYHASLTEEGRLINNNANALNNYCKKLQLTAQIQAASAKLTTAQSELRSYESHVSDYTPSCDTTPTARPPTAGLPEPTASATTRPWRLQSQRMALPVIMPCAMNSYSPGPVSGLTRTPASGSSTRT